MSLILCKENLKNLSDNEKVLFATIDGTIDEFLKRKDIQEYKNKQYGNTFKTIIFEESGENSMNKFKIGDRVKTKQKETLNNRNDFIIISIDNEDNSYLCCNEIDSFWINEKDLTLISCCKNCKYIRQYTEYCKEHHNYFGENKSNFCCRKFEERKK